MNREMVKVWGISIFSVVVLWSIASIIAGVAAKVLGANAIIYTCCVFIGSSFSLLLYSGSGDLGRETLRSIETWSYGLLLIIAFICSFNIFSYATATEVTLVQRSSIVASAFLSWVFLARKQSLVQILGILLVLMGIVIVCYNAPTQVKAYLSILVIIFAFLQAIRTLIAESHKTYNYAENNRTTKDKIRVVGYIMFVVSSMFLVVSFLFSLIEYSTGTNVSNIIPDLREFTNPASIFIGLFAGIVIFAPIRLVEFTAASKIKAENYLALGALGPFATLFWEWSTSQYTGLSLKDFSQNDLIATSILTLGGLIIAFSKAKKQIADDVNEYVSHTISDLQLVEDSKDVIEKSLTYFNKDLTKTSKELKLPEKVLKAVLETENVALKKEFFDKVSRAYRTEISVKDSLTGILNRSGLMQQLDLLKSKNKDFTLFYIDLNKFKPINDNYGHQAGDEALQIIAQRLSSLHKNIKIVSRLGGDEFVVILQKDLDLVDFTSKLHKKIEEFFTVECVNMVISVSASIGYVKSKDYKNLNTEELLELADKIMLDLKESNER
ncbi:MAG: putative diguanylate cyclase YeaP [Proteobacteria bacterium]|nr:MAG: putative diguanylate cyclase YeaP [Pseudomonadota bacterium]